MEEVKYLFTQLTNPEVMIHTGGLVLVLLVIFAENGLFFGFFLPGDTLLFTAGLLASTNKFQVSISLLLATVFVAAVLGSLVGYLFGLKTGDGFRSRKENIFFRKRYIDAAEAFFNKYGGRALVLGRFLPIIRTFAPIFAGIVKVKFSEYFIYNVVGAFLWVFMMTLLGYYVGQWVPNAKEILHYIILGIIVVTWIPVITTYIREQRKKRSISS
ncbi:MAG TPA: VTT domain-containing protein [Cytophagaceae bacterium]|jgi:membrane-associated protein|nr:VTT domain-containing protein [Cytophagaceae bacterium]